VPGFESYDLASRVVTLAGEAVQLSAKEYELLVALAEDPERVFKSYTETRDRLLAEEPA
jgi:DNA-binding response OmpR family regulator